LHAANAAVALLLLLLMVCCWVVVMVCRGTLLDSSTSTSPNSKPQQGMLLHGLPVGTGCCTEIEIHACKSAGQQLHSKTV
jgi:hypothetical protein